MRKLLSEMSTAEDFKKFDKILKIVYYQILIEGQIIVKWDELF